MISDIDLALGTVQRGENEPVSWHGLETVKEGLSLDDCGLRNMKIGRASLSATADGGEFPSGLEIPYTRHPINEGELLYVGKPYDKGSYFLLSNDAFLDFVKECFKAAGLDNKLAFTTTLTDGRKVTICKRIHEADFTDAHGHQVCSYINMFNSFDGSWALFANNSETRTVCFNTATSNINQGGCVCKHTTKGMQEFLDRFPGIFADAIKGHKGNANDYLKLAGITMNREDAKGFFASLLFTSGDKLSTRATNLISEALLPLFSKGRGCYGVSAADAYNAVTEHYTHTSTAESNSPGGTADNYKRDAKAKLLSDKLPLLIEGGKRLFAQSLE
jgi:hypothetical protein